jgi:hypothetical protein
MSPKGTPRIGAPRDPHEREQERIAAEVERREAALDEQAYHTKTVELSPAEIAQEERERRELAALLKETRPAKPRQERGAPESLSSHPISDIGGYAPERIADVADVEAEPVTITPPALDPVQAQTALSLIEEEIAVLKAERQAAEKASAEELKKIKATADLALAQIGRRQAEMEAKAHDARQAAARIELADRATAASREARANKQRASAGLDEKRKVFAETFQPLITTAKRVLREIAALNKQSGTALRELGALAGFDDTPTSWPTELRMKFRDQVIRPAREVVSHLDNCLTREDEDSPRYTVKRAEAMLTSWYPGAHMATLTMYLSRVNDDLLGSIRDQITTINDRFTMIEAQGQAYISSGEVVPEVIVMLNEGIRQDLKQHLIQKHLRDILPARADGVGDPGILGE